MPPKDQLKICPNFFDKKLPDCSNFNYSEAYIKCARHPGLIYQAMKSKLTSETSMRNPTASGQTPSAPGAGYSPSVPISVYRELAAELQTSKAMIDSLHEKNQQLSHQNQQLRQDIERVVQSAMNLQKTIQSVQPEAVVPAVPVPAHAELAAELTRSVASRTAQRPTQNPTQHPDRPGAPEAPSIFPDAAEMSVLSDELFTEQQEIRPRPEAKAMPARDLSGLWLTLTITAIVLTAFGAGFLVVRPLLPSSR